MVVVMVELVVRCYACRDCRCGGCGCGFVVVVMVVDDVNGTCHCDDSTLSV